MNPRRILIAPDSFGGWQSASEVAENRGAAADQPDSRSRNAP